MADYCMVCGKPSPCADHKLKGEAPVYVRGRPGRPPVNSTWDEVRAWTSGYTKVGASAQPGSPQFEGGAAYEDYQRDKRLSYDSKCRDLADHFLADSPGLRPLSIELAQHIQAAVEDWFSARGLS